jgi:hypothetical protein
MNSAEEKQKYQLNVRGLPGIMIAGPSSFELDLPRHAGSR